MNFSVGKQVFDGVEFPETIEIDGLEYALVNFGEHEISYLRADIMDKPVYTLMYRTMLVTDGVYCMSILSLRSSKQRKWRRQRLTS